MKRLKKYLPIIMGTIGSFGVVATAIATNKATIEAVDKPEEEKWKCYIPPVLMGAGTIACIMSSAILSYKQQVSLANAYMMAYQSLNEYRKKVVKRHGIEEDASIIEELRAERVDPKHSSWTENGWYCIDGFCDETEEPRLFYDESTKKYFEARPSDVLQAEYHMNRNYVLGWDVTLKDWCEFLGIEPIPNAEMMYIDYNFELGWIDFNHRKIELEDGLECWSIEMQETFARFN